MPVAQGTFRLRYGYQLLNNPNIGAVQHLYSYQNVQSSLRRIVYVSGPSISIANEDGTSIASILTSAISNPRATLSRDYIFFPQASSKTTWPSAQQSDGKKWHSTNGLSDWGLARPSTAVNITSTAVAGNITLASTVGRVYAGCFINSTTGHYSDVNVGLGSFATGNSSGVFPTAESQTSTSNIAWSNLANLNANDGVFTTAAISVDNGGDTETISATGFGFAIPATATISGIQATVNRRQSLGYGFMSITDATIQLLKAGVAVGDNRADFITSWPGSNTASSANYGGSVDLWNSTWTPAEVNAANFGISLAASGIGLGGSTGLNNNIGIDFVTLSITFATGSGSNTGAITSKQVSISLPTTNAPTGADMFAILATLDGGDTSTLYSLATVPIATTTFIDNIPDNVLVTNNIFAEVDVFGINHGITNNGFPPLQLQFPTKHRSRVYGTLNETIYFSKSLDEVTTSTGLVAGRFEEAWPATNTLDVSIQKENIRGLLSDGTTLYIGTERHIWRLDGDGPLNFSKPEIIFNEVGVLNQDTWQVCFAEGQPIGMVWMTPDNRVIMSNFSHYQDIGTPIQDILSTLNPSATNSAWGEFYSRESYDIYILAIPTGSNNSPDTLCVYDLRAGRWMIWKLADTPTAGLFNITESGTPQWLIASSNGKVYNLLPTALQDRVNDTPVPITYTLTTPWMHYGKPTERKSWNALEVVTADTNMLVSIRGASLNSQTNAPNVVVSNSPLVSSQFGYLKLYLAGKQSRDKHYQLTFAGNSAIQDVLLGYTAELIAFTGF